MSTKKKTIDEVRYIIEQTGCKLLSTTYINSKSNLSIRCICGNIFQRNYNNFMNNYKMCSECGNVLRSQNVKKYNYADVLSYINNIITGNGCTLLIEENEYLDVNTVLTIKCKCGELLYRTFHDFKRLDKHCKTCSQKVINKAINLDIKYVKNFIEIESESGCTLLSNDYFNNRELLLLKCKCGCEFKVSFHNFKGRKVRQCTKCSSKSYGEDTIRYLLKKWNTEFQEQFRFKDCRNKLPLPFDFVVFVKNSCNQVIKFLIEYQGEQHYSPNESTEAKNNSQGKFFMMKLKTHIAKIIIYLY